MLRMLPDCLVVLHRGRRARTVLPRLKRAWSRDSTCPVIQVCSTLMHAFDNDLKLCQVMAKNQNVTKQTPQAALICSRLGHRIILSFLIQSRRMAMILTSSIRPSNLPISQRPIVMSISTICLLQVNATARR